MQLSDEAINDFEKLWKEDHPGKEISRQDLIEIATRIMRAVHLVYKPIPKDKLDIYRKIQSGEKPLYKPGM